MVKRSKVETERFYRQLVAEQEESGLSVAAFAAARGMAPGTLSFWRHELRQRDAARADRSKATKPRFVEVKVVDAGAVASAGGADPAPPAKPATAGTAVYEVVLGRDRVLRLPADFDEARVAALVRAVASC